MKRVLALTALMVFAAAMASGVIVVDTSDNAAGPLVPWISSTDLVQGMIATELPGDMGWHPVNTNPADQLPAFTDGIMDSGTGLSGLLNDFPGAGTPTKKIQFDFASPKTIDMIRIYSENGDGRVFQTYTVEFSSDGSSWSSPIYVQSHASGTVNAGAYTQVLTELFDDAGPLATGVTNVRFDFYAVHSNDNTLHDPFDGVNPFTGVDDGLAAPFTSPLIKEIDIVPEPTTIGLLGLGLLGFLRRRRG